MPAYSFVRPYQATPRGQAPFILAIGDSICHGRIPDGLGGITYTGGWRRYIYAALVARSLTPTMIGVLLNSSDGLALSVAGLAHSGNDGATTAGWISAFAATKPTWDAQGTPTIVCLTTGANDGNTTAAGQSIGTLIDLAIAAYPLANIIVSTRTPNLGVASNLINAQIAVEVANRKATGRHIQLVDAFSAVPANTGYFPDTLHPSASGYSLLGDLWANAIVPLVT